MNFSLHEDYIEVRLLVPESGNIGVVSMPGFFLPGNEMLSMVLPIMQGMLWDGKGESFEIRRGEGRYNGFSMAMLGYLGKSGSLLVTAETSDGVLWWIGKDDTGRIWGTNLQISSLESMRYERIVRIYPVNPDIVAIAKRYRGRVIERGRFKSWKEIS